MREEGHEGCQRGQAFRGAGTQEKKRDRERIGELAGRYRYANYPLAHSGGKAELILGVCCGKHPGVVIWDSRVRVQDFLTEDTGRGHSLVQRLRVGSLR